MKGWLELHQNGAPAMVFCANYAFERDPGGKCNVIPITHPGHYQWTADETYEEVRESIRYFSLDLQ